MDIFEAKTKAWKPLRKQSIKDPEKNSSSKSIRISRILASTFAINQLISGTSEVDVLSNIERMQARIRNINSKVETRVVGGRRVYMRTRAQIEDARIMEQQLRKLKSNQSKKGIRKDNPTLNEAKKRTDWPLFQKAIDEELHQIAVEEKAHESKPVDRSRIPKEANIIGSMLVLTVKRLPNGQIDKYKARLVALGNHQKENSYEHIKAGTVRGIEIVNTRFSH